MGTRHILGSSQADIYTAGMIDQNDKEYFNVNGLMIYDPSIQYPVTSQVAALPFVEGEPHIQPASSGTLADRFSSAHHDDLYVTLAATTKLERAWSPPIVSHRILPTFEPLADLISVCVQPIQ